MVPLLPLLPLFPGVPGGPELLVILLLLVALFGLPVVIAFLGWRHLRGDTRIEELEARIRELESEHEMTGVDSDEEAVDDSDVTDFDNRDATSDERSG